MAGGQIIREREGSFVKSWTEARGREEYYSGKFPFTRLPAAGKRGKRFLKVSIKEGRVRSRPSQVLVNNHYQPDLAQSPVNL